MDIGQLKKFRSELMQIAGKYQIDQVYVFGSVARGETTETSDVDFLIQMRKDASALGVGGFQYEAQSLLGAKVDVVPTFALEKVRDKKFVEAIQMEAVPL